jgi:16S rRNA (cytosine967-C5)-methyltransferase
MNPQITGWAADAVAAWFVDRTSPRDAMAAMPALREALPSDLAAVARAAAAALGGMRRLEFALAGGQGLVGMMPRRRAHALVLAAAVLRDEMLPDGASRQFGAGDGAVDFARLLRVDEAIAATPDPVARFGRRHSVPDWFAARLMAQHGDEADAIATALASPAPRTLRANLLKVRDRDELARELAAERVPTRPARFAATALHVDGDADLFATMAFQRGAFEQQDEASQLACAAVAPPPGGKVLDACAGNGGKTLALAAALANRGVVAAADVHEGRLEALRKRARRAGATNLAVHRVDERSWTADVLAFAGRADRILIDAPCTGTGSWRRRPEARWGIDEASFHQLARAQEDLLGRAAAALRPGARLIYATCSLLAEENEARVASLLRRRPELEVVRLAEILGAAAATPIADATGAFLSLRPDRHGCDGFFAAVLRRPRAGSG